MTDNERAQAFPRAPRLTDGPTRRRLLQGAASLPWLGVFAGCGGRTPGDGSTDMAAGGGASAQAFVHPGLLHTEADFSRMREKVAAGAQPWLDGWNALTGSSRTRYGTPAPDTVVVRGGDGENFRNMVEQMLRAYQCALRWKVSGDTAYADAAVAYLDAWSSTMTTLTGNADRFLAAGIYGYQWANAGEIMRSYPGWSAAGLARFQTLMLEVFHPLSHDFLLRHNGADITNYWANWDLCNIAAILAIGVFCDRRDLYDEALDYYLHGRGNGAAAHLVYVMHPGHLGQWQESGRDQGHATLGPALAGPICEMAWNQGDDLYGHANNRLLAGAEYVAASNLADAAGSYASLPFSVYVNRQGTSTSLSTAGRPNLRHCWEMIRHHYVHRRGLSAPYVSAMAAQLRPERDQWNGDQPSMGTLTFTREPLAAPVAPSGLTAHQVGGQIVLSWWGSAGASGYEVERAASADGPFGVIAQVDERRTHTDAPGGGAWHYRVAALVGGTRLVGASVRAFVGTELRIELPLDAGSGTIAADTGGAGRHGMLAGGAGWGAGRTGGHALSLDGQGGHLVLPSGVLQDLSDFTITLWVHWNAASTNTRVFDFGSSDIAYLALLPRDGAGRLRCAITGTHFYGEQSIAAGAALPTGRWVHLAVTLSGTVGTLYVDGAVAATNDTISFAPFQLGATTQNWLGRSQYAADPAFDGRLQDFRLYSGALSAAEVAALAAA